ncbi:FISUMP domain-containing protein, partial [Bergeyella sp. RCAD1439]|uniref:FISUMP domain-containing protein n=1 Tax=Bergeyella anatis TaxID=3113737 RepID=UPI002E18A6B9|nr:FISUMP domain-containing protein [Bergeyella sp. RCAD1439]
LNNLDLSNAISISNGLGINGSSNSSVTLPANQSLTLTYPVTGTPTAPGTATATFSSAPFATLTTNFNISAATATLGPVKDQLIVALNYNGQKYHSPATGIPDGYEFEVKIPYTNANPTNGSYLAYEQILPLQNDTGGTQNFKLYYPAGTLAGASGTITAKLRNVSGSSFKAKTYGPDGQQYNLISGASAYTITFNGNISSTPFGVKATGGIPDRCFGKTTLECLADMGSPSSWASTEMEHQFIYIPITGPDGKTWLNNNLGAEYARVGSPVFNPTQQATSKTDHNAYGSLFQWQRKPDGHELITWTSSTNGTPKYTGSGSVSSSWANAGTNNFIPYNSSDYSWVTSSVNQQTSSHQLWRANGANNPCPEGYHVPTLAEWQALHTAITGATGTTSSGNSNMWNETGLRLPASGYRWYNDGSFNSRSSYGYFWSSEAGNSSHSWALWFSSSSSRAGNNNYRATGFSVRCLQD